MMRARLGSGNATYVALPSCRVCGFRSLPPHADDALPLLMTRCRCCCRCWAAGAGPDDWRLPRGAQVHVAGRAAHRGQLPHGRRARQVRAGGGGARWCCCCHSARCPLPLALRGHLHRWSNKWEIGGKRSGTAGRGARRRSVEARSNSGGRAAEGMVAWRRARQPCGVQGHQPAGVGRGPGGGAPHGQRRHPGEPLGETGGGVGVEEEHLLSVTSGQSERAQAVRMGAAGTRLAGRTRAATPRAERAPASRPCPCLHAGARRRPRTPQARPRVATRRATVCVCDVRRCARLWPRGRSSRWPSTRSTPR